MTQHLQSPKRKDKIRRTYRKASNFLYIDRGEWRIRIERRWLGGVEYEGDVGSGYRG